MGNQDSPLGERVAIMETKVATVVSDMSEVKADVKTLNKNLWIGVGILIAVSTILQFVFHK